MNSPITLRIRYPIRRDVSARRYRTPPFGKSARRVTPAGPLPLSVGRTRADRSGRRGARGASRQLSIDLLDRASLCLHPEEQEDQSRLPVPEREEEERREDRVDRRLGAHVIGRADHHRQPERADDLAEIADPVAEPHAAGAQSVRPYL